MTLSFIESMPQPPKMLSRAVTWKFSSRVVVGSFSPGLHVLGFSGVPQG
jgi:uncharacterized membrane protein